MTTARLSLAFLLSAAALFASAPASAPNVEGRVVDGDGNPVADVMVYTGKTDVAAPLRTLAATPSKVKTGSDGRFSLQLDPATYDVVFQKKGFVSKRLRSRKIGKKRHEINVTLERAAVVGGRVARRDGSSIANAMVDATNVADSIPVKTREDGTFVFEDLPKGEVTLLVSKREEFIRELKTVTTPVRDVVFEIETGGTIRGRVVAESTGAPVEKFTVHLLPVAARDGVSPSASISKSLSSPDGSFELRNVASSEIQIAVTAPDFLPSQLTPAWLESGGTLDAGVIAMTAGTPIRGTVTAEGTPVGGVAVALESPDGATVAGLDWITARTNAEGKFALVAPPYRDWVITFRKSAFINARKQIAVSDSAQQVDVELQKGLRITGIVVDRNEKPVAGATIKAYSSVQGTEPIRALADEEGRFALQGVVEGQYYIEVSKPGFIAGKQQEVNLRNTRELRLVLDSGATITGVVRGLEEAMMNDVWVVAEGSGTFARTRLEAGGKFRLQVSPGALRVFADIETPAMQRMTPVKSVEATVGRESRVDLDFATGGSLRGIVTRDALPVGGHFVTAEPFDPRIRTRARATTHAAGAYELSGLDRGEYTVRVLERDRILYEKLVKVDGAVAHDIQIATARLFGLVVDAKTGEPLSGVTIALKKSSRETTDVFAIASSLTDAEGRYAISAVPPGMYEVRAHKDSYGHVLVEKSLEAGANVEQLFKLDPQSNVALRIHDERDGKPLAAEIWVMDGMKRTILQGSPKPGSDGRVRFSVAPGSYFVSVGAFGYAAKIVPFRVPSAEVAIPMSPGGSIVFHATSKQLVRIVHATGTCYLPSFYSGRCEIPIEPGTTKFDFLQKGHWKLYVLDEAGKILRSYPFEIEDKISVEFPL